MTETHMAQIEPRPPKASLRHDDIGGGKVKRGFRSGEKWMPVGTLLSRDEILAYPYANRCALIDRFIEVWPREAMTAQPKGPLKRVIIHSGAGRYHVIEGVVLNEEPLTKEEAEALKERAEADSG